MSVVFAEERVVDCWNEVLVLAHAHWQSTKSYRRHQPFAPSLDRYASYNQRGYFFLFTARDEGVLIGYFGVYLTPSMHSQWLMATEDTFFLDPAHRGARTALRFLEYIEAQCRARGVREIMFSCEADNTSGIQRLLAHCGYQPVITQFSKIVDTRDAAMVDDTGDSRPAADSGLVLHQQEVAHVRTRPARCT